MDQLPGGRRSRLAQPRPYRTCDNRQARQVKATLNRRWLVSHHICSPVMLASARSPCTVSLLPALLQTPIQAGQTLLRCPLGLRKTKPLLSNALFGPCADLAVLLIQFL